MTISPVAPPVTAPAAGGSSGGSANADFASLVQEHLTQEDSGQDRPAALSGESAAAVLEAASSPSAVPSDGLAALLAGLLAGGASAADAAASDGQSGTADTANDSVTGATGEDGNVANASAPAGALLTALAGGAPGASASDGQGAVAAGTTALVPGAAAEKVAAAPALPGVGASTSAGVAETGTDSTAQQAGAAKDADASAAGSTPASTSGNQAASGTAATGLSALGVVGPAGGVADTGATAAAQSAPGSTRGSAVTDQVFRHVTRLVSRGDGTHRLMLRLHPADLGEVKVVLTVRDNTVDVMLAAGPEAREALRDGSPQLRSLLELTGAATRHVVVRDLVSGEITATSTSNGSSSAGSGQQQSADNGAGRSAYQGTAEHGATFLARGGAGGQPGAREGNPTVRRTSVPLSRLDLNL